MDNVLKLSFNKKGNPPPVQYKFKCQATLLEFQTCPKNWEKDMVFLAPVTHHWSQLKDCAKEDAMLFLKLTCNIYYKKQLVLTGRVIDLNELSVLPIGENTKQTSPQKSSKHYCEQCIHSHKNDKKTKHMHQTFMTMLSPTTEKSYDHAFLPFLDTSCRTPITWSNY